MKRHIEILLLDNDCVIVPGLGGFVAHYVEARYDGADNSYLPPSRTLGFNAKLDMNDSLLAQSYVEAYDISYPEAVGRIEAEVDDIRRALQKEGFYDFADLGVLTVNTEGNYEFSPCASGVLTPELYGLSSFEIERSVQPAGQQPEAAVLAPAGRGMEPSAVGAPSAARPDFPYGESTLAEQLSPDDGGAERTISIRVSLLRNVLAAACAIIAFFLLASPINNNETGAGVMSGLGSGLLYSLVPDGTHARPCQPASPLVAKAGSIRTAEAPVAAARPDSVVKETAENADEGYSIVLASRITKANAEAYVSRLRSEGYQEARVLERKGEHLKVVYGSYEDEGAALRSLRSLRQKPEFEHAWIYKDNK